MLQDRNGRGRRKTMSTVKLIDGRVIEHVQLTNIERVGDEGARSAIAEIDGIEYPVYNSIVDGFNPIWTEQMSMPEFRRHQKTQAVIRAMVSFIETTLADDELYRLEETVKVSGWKISRDSLLDQAKALLDKS
jgi:hypothetical protein